MRPATATLQFPCLTPDGEDETSDHHARVFELPWPDFLGNRTLYGVLEGQIFDMRKARPHDTQRVTDILMADMERYIEQRDARKAQFSAGVVSLPVYEFSPGSADAS